MPNHVENDLYIDGPAEDVAALLVLIGADETPPAFDFKCLIPYPEPFASMDADHRAAEEAGKAAGLAAIGEWPPFDHPEFSERRAAYWRAASAAMDPLMDAYEAKWGTRRDGYNAGGYEWCSATWGTKWGAYDVERRDRRGRVCLTFRTAWSPPADEVFAALHRRFPRVTLAHEYFERGMGFCGGGEWPSEEDWYEDGPWAPGTKINAWESRAYRGVRGG